MADKIDEGVLKDIAIAFIKGLLKGKGHGGHHDPKYHTPGHESEVETGVKPWRARVEPKHYTRTIRNVVRTRTTSHGIRERAEREGDVDWNDHKDSNGNIIGKIKKTDSGWKGVSSHRNADGSSKIFTHTNREKVKAFLNHVNNAATVDTAASNAVNEMASVKRIHEVECPRCHAKAGERCTDKKFGKPLSSFHNERARAANEKDAEIYRKGKEAMKNESVLYRGFHIKTEPHATMLGMFATRITSQRSGETAVHPEPSKTRSAAVGKAKAGIDAYHAARKANEETELKDIEEGLRLTKTYENGNKKAKVYRDSEWDEHRVELHVDGKHQKKADYHTDDKEDAHRTARHMIGLTNEAVNESDEHLRKIEMDTMSRIERKDGSMEITHRPSVATGSATWAQGMSNHLAAHGVKHSVVDHGTYSDKKGPLYKMTVKLHEGNLQERGVEDYRWKHISGVKGDHYQHKDGSFIRIGHGKFTHTDKDGNTAEFSDYEGLRKHVRSMKEDVEELDELSYYKLKAYRDATNKDGNTVDREINRTRALVKMGRLKSKYKPKNVREHAGEFGPASEKQLAAAHEKFPHHIGTYKRNGETFHLHKGKNPEEHLLFNHTTGDIHDGFGGSTEHVHNILTRLMGFKGKTHVKEEVEQVDEVSAGLLKRYSSAAGNDIKARSTVGRSFHDAVDGTRGSTSNAKKIRKRADSMLVAAAKQKVGEKVPEVQSILPKVKVYAREEAEQVDEISRDLAHNYLGKAVDSVHDLAFKRGVKAGKGVAPTDDKVFSRKRGIRNAIKKLAGGGANVRAEETEIDEKHLGFKKLEGKLSHEKGIHDPAALAAYIGRKKYGAKKFNHMAHEEVEHLDEVGDTHAGQQALKRYVRKAMKSYVHHDAEVDRHLKGSDGSPDSSRLAIDKGMPDLIKMHNRNKGVIRAGKRIKEETVDEVFKDTLYGYRSKAALDAVDKGIEAGMHLQKGDEVAFRKTGKKAYNRARGSLLATRKLEKSKLVNVHASEAVIDEISKKGLGNYINGAAKDIDSRSFEHGGEFYTAKKPDRDANDKREQGINKRLYYIKKAVGRLTKEENEMSIEEGKTYRINPENLRSSKKNIRALRKADKAAGRPAKPVAEESESVEEGKTYRANSDYRSQRSKRDFKKFSKAFARNRDAKRANVDKVANEEVEQIDEIGDTYAGQHAIDKYIVKAHASMAKAAEDEYTNRKKYNTRKSNSPETDKASELGHKAEVTYHKRRIGIERARKRFDPYYD